MATVASIESRIEAVTVFRRGALVTRVAEIDAPQPGVVRISGLPIVADDGSFRVRLSTPEDEVASWSACDLRVALDVPRAATSIKQHDERLLDEARAEQERLAAQIAHVERELTWLERLSFPKRPPGQEGEAPGLSPTDARLALVGFRSDRTRRLTEQRIDLRVQLREATERHREIQDRVRRASTDRRIEPHALRKAVVVTLGRSHGSGADSPIRLRLEYRVPGARWAPAYAFRLSRRGDAGSLAMRALVAQQTGEDWNGVRVTLATANPQVWTDLPELQSLRVGRRQAPPARLGWRPPPTGAEQLYEDWDRVFAGVFRDEEAALPAAVSGELEAVETLGLEDFELGEDIEFETGGLEEDVPLGAAPAAAARPPEAMRPRPMSLSAMPSGASLSASLPQTMASAGGVRQRTMSAPVAPVARRVASARSRARDDMLAYTSLYLPSPRSHQRGHLVLAEKRHLYIEWLIEESPEFDWDPEPLIKKATQRAESAGARLPPRFQLAEAADGFDHAYVAQAPADIPSDRHYHSLALLECPVKAELRHVSVPRESLDVFRVARTTNSLPGPVLPGPADVYLEGEFLLTTDAHTTPSGAVLELGLGVDQAVRVSRRTHFREETKGLTKGRLALAHDIAIDIQNNLDSKIQIEVRERVPVTQRDEQQIRVEIGAVEPSWNEYQPGLETADRKLEGGYVWSVPVEPGEQVALRAEYRIDISSKHEIVAGNRREA